MYEDYEEYERKEKERKRKIIRFSATIGAVVGGIALVASRVRIASASEYIVKTGIGITDISISKKTVVWPFQRASVMSIEPLTFPIEVDAMSAQRIPFRMPSVWTIGPKNEQESLNKYSRLLMDKGVGGLHETVAGVIQGETRVLTANLDLNVLFSERDVFKNEVVDRINRVIDPFGLHVYNANIAELRDLDEHNQFFAEQKKRALQKVNQEARVNVAEAIKDGEIGEKKFQSESRQGVAFAEKDAKLVEYERDKEIAESLKNLEVAKAEFEREANVAKIQSSAESEKRKWELQMFVEEQRKIQEMERKRADHLTTANVEAEIAIRRAEGESSALRLKAEAELFAKQQEAMGILALREAEAEGLGKLIQSAGNVDCLNRYILIRDNILPQLADKQANAIQGLQPKINIWNTGQNQGNFSHVVGDLFKTGMPLFDGIKAQTGYDFLKSVGVQKEEI